MISEVPRDGGRSTRPMGKGLAGVKLLLSAAALAATVGGWSLLSTAEAEQSAPPPTAASARIDDWMGAGAAGAGSSWREGEEKRQRSMLPAATELKRSPTSRRPVTTTRSSR